MSGKEIPWVAYYQYLNEYKLIQHQKLAENVAAHIISNSFEIDCDGE